MPLSRLEIEQTAQDRWVAEVEVGGISNYRITVRGNTFAQIIAECERAYYEKRPDERPMSGVIPDDVGCTLTLEDGEDDGWSGPISLTKKPKRVLSEEHKRAMAEGRARARAARDLEDIEDAVDEGPNAA
jgi:hypothetical protein